MKAPIIRVFINDNKRDLSERVESFRFEDCLNEDDSVEFNIKAGYAMETADDDDLVAGTILQYQFGFAGATLSETHKVRLTDVETTYAERIKLKLRGTDMGVVMKKTSSLKVWKGMTSSQIAEEIAARYELEAKIEPTTKVWSSLPQGNKSDFKFLQHLATKESKGDFIFFIRNNTLHFEKRGLEKSSSMRFKYGEVGVISFSPKYRETTAKGSTNSVKTVAVDPMTKQTKVKSSNEGKDGDASLGKKVLYIDVNAEKLQGSKIVQDGTAAVQREGLVEGGKKYVGDLVEQVVPVPPTDDSELLNMAKGRNKKSGQKVLVAELKVEGNPLLVTNEIVTVENVAKRHGGNWLVEKVIHDISATGGYTCTLSLTKNGTQKSTNKKNGDADKVNNTKGKEKQPTKVIYVSVNNTGPERAKYVK